MNEQSNLEVKGDKPATETGSDFEKIFRVDQTFQSQVTVKQVISTIKVGRPNKTDFFRVHSTMGMKAGVIKLEDATYMVVPSLIDDIPQEVSICQLYATMNRAKGLTIWPIKEADSTGKLDNWNASALEAAELAKKSWVRLVSDRPNGCYQPMVATITLPEPDWPEISWGKWLELAFKGRIIDSLDHLVIRQLRGLA